MEAIAEMTTFSFLAGVGVAMVAPQYVVPGFIALELYRCSVPVKPQPLFALPNCKTDPNSWQCEISAGFEYAIGYYIGNAVMSALFGAQ